MPAGVFRRTISRQKRRRQQGRNSMSVSRYLPLARGILLGAALAMTSSAALAQKREFSFAYDQPKNSGYGSAPKCSTRSWAS